MEHSQTSFTKNSNTYDLYPVILTKNLSIQITSTASPTNRPQQVQPLIEKALQLFQAEVSKADQLATAVE